MYNPDKTADKLFPNTCRALSNEISATEYMTLSFSLNEATNNIGTKDDTVETTTWGSWNSVLSSIYTWNPTIRLGIILYDDQSEFHTMHDTIKDIAKWWGIPVLDLVDDTSVPLMMSYGARPSTELNQWIANVKNHAFRVSDTADSVNKHPNYAAHKYRSTIIENFMRSL